MNELAEKAWQETQSAFGSSANAGGSFTMPVSTLNANLGVDLKNEKTGQATELSKDDYFKKVTQSKERNWTNVLLRTQGGDINAARLITRLESNTGPELQEWLKSIPKYPKAFKLKMRPINELIDFNVKNLFMGSGELWQNGTCTVTETRQCIHGTSVEQFQKDFDKRRHSLGFAIEIFRHRVCLFCVSI